MHIHTWQKTNYCVINIKDGINTDPMIVVRLEMCSDCRVLRMPPRKDGK